MVNLCVLVGRLGRDPETRYTDGGATVSNFSMATEESFKDRSGERQKRTEWHRVVLWGKLAEIAQQYLKKGMLVYVEGRIQSSEWEKDGEKQRSFEIVANVLRMLETKQNMEPAAADSRPQPASRPPSQQQSSPAASASSSSASRTPPGQSGSTRTAPASRYRR